MNEEVKALWLADLRSGVPQGRMLLFDGVGHCCLGRLCEVAVKAGVIPPMWTTLSVHRTTNYCYGDDSHSSTTDLPRAVREWAGFDDGNPEIAPEVTAATANDDFGWDFNAIADAIDEYL